MPKVRCPVPPDTVDTQMRISPAEVTLASVSALLALLHVAVTVHRMDHLERTGIYFSQFWRLGSLSLQEPACGKGLLSACPIPN